MGMVGGGRGAFIGAVHRNAAFLDGRIALVAGAFSSDAEKSKASAKDFHIDPARAYASYEEMAKAEAKLPEDERIDFVSVVTPNFTHYDIASTFLKAGFNVICDKPMTYDLAQAKRLRKLVEKSGKVFALTHNYTGYPMVKEARQLVARGKIGKVLKVVVEYPQGWLLHASQAGGGDINMWRTDPAKSGAANCMGDIGTHAENLARYITGLEIDEMCAELTSFVDGHKLDDDGNCLIRYKGGAKGILWASQIAHGEENNLNIRVYGEKGSLQWFQEHPNELIVRASDQPVSIRRRGNGYLGKPAQAYTRLPFGHPEAFIEAFANIYSAAADAIEDEVTGKYPKKKGYDFPNVDDGVVGMAFIDTVVKSAQAGKWTKFSK